MVKVKESYKAPVVEVIGSIDDLTGAGGASSQDTDAQHWSPTAKLGLQGGRSPAGGTVVAELLDY